MELLIMLVICYAVVVWEPLVVNGLITFDSSLESDCHWSLLLRNRRAIPSRRGQAKNTSSCDVIQAVPDDVRASLSLDNFYQKYTDAYGIPILSSSQVADEALHRACYVVRVMLADRKDIRDAMHDGHGRVVIIGLTELTTDIPEHSFLPDRMNDRARGLGGTPRIPVTSISEENVLCLGQDQDRWYEEDILIHEFAHSIHLIGVNKVNESFQTRLDAAYNNALYAGLWRRTYASSKSMEYFAEGVQKYFNVDTHRELVDGVHNNISTRDKLMEYDIQLFDLISEVFPCGNEVIKRCQNQSLAASQVFRMNCQSAVEQTSTSSEGTSTSRTSLAFVKNNEATTRRGILSTEAKFDLQLDNVMSTYSGNGVQCLTSKVYFVTIIICLVLLCVNVSFE